MKELNLTLLEDIEKEKLSSYSAKGLRKLWIEDINSFHKETAELLKNYKQKVRSDILYSLLTSSDPEMAVKKFNTILSTGVVVESKYAIDLIKLLAASNFLGNFIVRNPNCLDLMNQIDFFRNRITSQEHIERLRDETARMDDWEEIQSALRLYKYRDYLRITLQSLKGSIDLVQTTQELSSLADATVSICLNKAFEIISRQNDIKEPSRLDFAVVGLGKLGGSELNYSSDIDIMYIYDVRQEHDDCKEYYAKLSELLTRMLSEKTPDGFLYRVDLRLRPDGDRGQICQELSNILRYYEYAGRTWERSIFLRSRFIAGNRAVFDKFISSLEPFVFKKYLDYGTIEDLREMKIRISRQVSMIKPGVIDIKNGRGGIREIEFFVHALLLINGGRIPAIREINTLRAIAKLKAKGLISHQRAADLSDSYTLLRKAEHAMQIRDELQTWKIPTEGSEIRKLALRAFPDLVSQSDCAAVFSKRLADTRKTVSSIYDSLFKEKGRSSEKYPKVINDLLISKISEEQAAEKLIEIGFREGLNSARNFRELKMLFPDIKFSARGKKALRELLPEIITSASKAPEPDMALASFIKFARQVRMHSSYFTLLKENKNTLELLMALFGTSQFLSSFLLKHPELLDYLVLAGNSANVLTPDELKRSIFENLKGIQSIEDSSNMLRRLNNQEILRVALNEMYSSFDTPMAMKELTKIADTFIYFCYLLALNGVFFPELSVLETASKAENNDLPFTVVAMGKLGSGEFSYKSDLDLIFLYDGQRKDYAHEQYAKLAQKIISLLSIPTEEGYLYRVDMRLRPSGSRGTLVTSVQSFCDYHSKRSRIWEKQALLRARYVCGSESVWKKIKPVIRDYCFASFGEESVAELVKIKNSLEKELASANEDKYNLKSGKGGLLDLEFALHILELKHGKKFDDFKAYSTAELLDKFLNMNIIGKDMHSKLLGAYDFMKRLEHRIRLIKDRQISSFKGQSFELHKIAKSFSHEYDGGVILEKYKEYSNIIRSFYLETIGEA